MTPFPHFVHPQDPVDAVEGIMQERDVRHVPVVEDGRVVGIVSERDLRRLVNPALPAIDKRHIRVRAILQPDPFVVELDEPLARVVEEMADRKLGSAIVTRRGRLAGVLTTVDVCRQLAALLRRCDLRGGDEAS